MAIRVLPVSAEQLELLDAVVAVGDRYTKYLGLLTPPAYRKHAEDGGLLVAVDDEEVVGYALFGLPERSPYVRLAHLCVAEEHRGRGVARELIEAIRARHAHSGSHLEDLPKAVRWSRAYGPRVSAVSDIGPGSGQTAPALAGYSQW
ncbi:hypothetical protein GCM10015535_36860 [Streptomyces gelaticus]|uniref:N-acetyltransferase domain-containing protein n=1 Tax=Streptomyces gelaticus TaxID=285446 RepID=A0ABQ2VZZ4_9ACTN|nr:GNAT family N-acetyltransferase [Streptomyces gelaticus]GGV87332.1 hypothetical protein GCM10015535_36860 [Streptomyces gelaticus]